MKVNKARSKYWPLILKQVTKFIYYLAALVKLKSFDLNAKLFCNKSGT